MSDEIKVIPFGCNLLDRNSGKCIGIREVGGSTCYNQSLSFALQWYAIVLSDRRIKLNLQTLKTPNPWKIMDEVFVEKAPNTAFYNSTLVHSNKSVPKLRP